MKKALASDLTKLLLMLFVVIVIIASLVMFLRAQGGLYLNIGDNFFNFIRGCESVETFAGDCKNIADFSASDLEEFRRCHADTAKFKDCEKDHLNLQKRLKSGEVVEELKKTRIEVKTDVGGGPKVGEIQLPGGT